MDQRRNRYHAVRLAHATSRDAVGREDHRLFHATAEPDVRYHEGLAKLAARAGVRLHVWVRAEQGALDSKRIRAVPEWKSADVWFCGPVDFGKALEKGLRAAGLPARDFHQELFHFR